MPLFDQPSALDAALVEDQDQEREGQQEQTQPYWKQDVVHDADVLIGNGIGQTQSPTFVGTLLSDQLSAASLPCSRPERELAEKQRWSAAYQDCGSSVVDRNFKARL